MEYNEKLQELRKQKGLTQEELAGMLFVSRTAVSKWESGRGYPSIDSLKAIAKFYAVSVDDLLSGDDLLTIAEEDRRQKETGLHSLMFGLLDVTAALFFFLPLFGEETGSIVQPVSLLSLTAAFYLKILYCAAVIGITLFGVLTLALQNCRRLFWVQNKNSLSLGLTAAGVLLFIIGRQPYAAALLFIFLLLKVLVLLKKR